MSETTPTPRPAVEKIPLELLYGNPEKTAPQISPDGKHLGWIEPVNGVLNVVVVDIDAPLEQARPVTDDTDRGVRIWHWGEDNRHLLYLQDVGGDENWHLYGVDLETMERKDYTPFDGVQVRLVDWSKERPDEVLVSMNRENEELHDVYRLRLSDGHLERLTENPGYVIGWEIGADLEVLGALTSSADGGRSLLLKPLDREVGTVGEWETVAEWEPEDATSSYSIGFNRAGTELYLIDTRDSNAARLVRMNVADRSLEVLFEDPVYDVTFTMRDRDRYEPVLVGVHRERMEWEVLDESYRADIEYLHEVVGPDAQVAVVSRSNDENTWIFAAVPSDASPQYWLYDRPNRTARFLFAARPELDRFPLAPMEGFSFTARDGRTIHGYITFPLDAERRNLPMVLNVHGGPWVRDTWGYHPEAQWLANRGYICMQVNYRGSAGYGKDHMNAGDREWGGKMHDDLIDAVNWAIENGYADPDRVAIFGGSYGGYAALVGATFTPDAFRCSVALVGPSNLITFLETIPPYWRPLRGQMRRRVGDLERDRDFLLSRSPITHVDRIRIPMLIAHGANDPRVKQDESEQIVAAMQEKGIDHEYLLFPDEGHGFAKPENRMKFYRAVDAFLEKHL